MKKKGTGNIIAKQIRKLEDTDTNGKLWIR